MDENPVVGGTTLCDRRERVAHGRRPRRAAAAKHVDIEPRRHTPLVFGVVHSHRDERALAREARQAVERTRKKWLPGQIRVLFRNAVAEAHAGTGRGNDDEYPRPSVVARAD
jgi:hypothetical protein